MANYIGAKLSKLIKQRAYSAGEIKRLAELEIRLSAVIAKARIDLRTAKKNGLALQERVCHIDEEIHQLSVMDPVEIRHIKVMPRIMKGKTKTHFST